MKSSWTQGDDFAKGTDSSNSLWSFLLKSIVAKSSVEFAEI